MIDSNYSNSALLTISKLCKTDGILCLIISIIGIIIGFYLVADNETSGFYIVIFSLIFGIIYPLISFASAEIIKLFIQIEKNTRTPELKNNEKNLNTNKYSSEESETSSISKEQNLKSINEYYANKRKS